ncbi:L-sorbosone dehydrogenase-like protein [Cladobotryum mycophilum]|uniref:L-sorbosone dehydrogenase-like protein n=1 Tax=Cladobotryum mycophilum TaxID=491253 RepID=A0ABR0S737_9HYPO
MAMKSVALTFLLGAHFGSAASDGCSNTLTTSYPAPVAARGWQYRLVANGFTKPRGIAFDQDGGLLVIDSGVGLVHLSLKDEGSTCLSVAEKKTLVANTQLNHGIALSNDGKTVYVSSSEAVYSFAYDSKAVTLDTGSNHTIVANMSNSDHTTRTLLMSNKKSGTLVVSRGSDSNEDSDALNKDSGHSQIRSYDLGKLGKNDTYEFLDGDVLGWGLRNSVGVAENPSTGGIWSVENSVDQLDRKGKDIHENNPAEELNYHGGNYGYPVCYTIWSTQNFPELGSLKVGDQFPDDSAPSTLTDQACNSQYVPAALPLQAHAAPLDIKFTSDGSKAYVTFHGSWDSTNPVGYRVASIDFNKDGQPSAAKTSTDAAVDVLTNPDNSKCPKACFRPVGLAWDAKNRLFLSSDSTGEIFVLEQNGQSSGGGSSSDGGSGAGALFPKKSAAIAVGFAAVLAGMLLA